MKRFEEEVYMLKKEKERDNSKLSVTEAILTKTKVDLQDALNERDSQMNALATMLSRGEEYFNHSVFYTLPSRSYCTQ